MDNTTFERHYRAQGFASQRRYPNEQMIQFLAAHYFGTPRRKRKKVRMLEVGCGSGANLWVVAREGFDAYGMDNAPSSVPLCRKMLRSYGVAAKLSVGTVRALKYKENFFDAVLDVLTVEHTDLEGHRQAFAEVFRVLKPGGRFFSWHLGSGSVSFTRGGGKKVDRYTTANTPNRAVPYANNGLTCFIPAPLASAMLKEAGFADIQIERVVRTYKNMTQTIEYLAIQARKP